MTKEKFGVEGEGKEQKQYPFARDLTTFMNTPVETQYDIDPDLPEDDTDKRILRTNEHGMGEHENNN